MYPDAANDLWNNKCKCCIYIAPSTLCKGGFTLAFKNLFYQYELAYISRMVSSLTAIYTECVLVYIQHIARQSMHSLRIVSVNSLET